MIVTGSVPAVGQDCLDYGDYMHWTGKADTSGDSEHVVYDGEYAYTTGYRLNVVDCADPTNPQVVGTVDTPGSPQQVAVAGDYAFVADRQSGLQIIDISNPAWPWIVSSLSTGDNILKVAYANGYVYMADDSGTLLVVDVSDPDVPILVGIEALPQDAAALAIEGDLACVSLYGGSLWFFDITDPTDPVLLSSLGDPAYASTLVIDGDYLYGAASGLTITDISDLSAPAIVSTLDFGRYTYGLDVADGYAFLTSGLGDVSVVDVADPSAPVVIGVEHVTGISRGVSVANGYVCVVNNNLHLIEVNDPIEPGYLATLATPDITEVIEIAGDFAFLVSNYELQIVDITDPIAPVAVAQLDFPEGITDVSISGNYAYTINSGYPSVFTVIDISDVTSPVVVSTDESALLGMDLAAYGSYVYVATALGTHIYDCTDPMSPIVYPGPTAPNLMGFRVIDGVLYGGGSGIWIFDLTDPLVPVEVGQLAATGVLGFDVVGNLLVAAASYWGVLLVDIVDPTNPQLIGSIVTQSESWDVAIHSNTAYVADHGSGVTMINISVPTIPQIVGTLGPHGYCADVAANDECMFMAAWDLHTAWFDCGEVTATYLSDFDLRVESGVVHLQWSLSTTAEADAFRVEVQRDGRQWTVPVSAIDSRRFAADDRSAFVAEGGTVVYTLYYRDEGGAWHRLESRAIDLTQTPPATRLLEPYPNPFNPSTTVRFDLVRDERVTLTVFDVAGRPVTTLARGPWQAGRHEIVWYGQDDDGRPMASGAYYVRLETADSICLKKAMLLK